MRRSRNVRRMSKKVVRRTKRKNTRRVKLKRTKRTKRKNTRKRTLRRTSYNKKSNRNRRNRRNINNRIYGGVNLKDIPCFVKFDKIRRISDKEGIKPSSPCLLLRYMKDTEDTEDTKVLVAYRAGTDRSYKLAIVDSMSSSVGESGYRDASTGKRLCMRAMSSIPEQLFYEEVGYKPTTHTAEIGEHVSASERAAKRKLKDFEESLFYKLLRALVDNHTEISEFLYDSAIGAATNESTAHISMVSKLKKIFGSADKQKLEEIRQSILGGIKYLVEKGEVYREELKMYNAWIQEIYEVDAEAALKILQDQKTSLTRDLAKLEEDLGVLQREIASTEQKYNEELDSEKGAKAELDRMSNPQSQSEQVLPVAFLLDRKMQEMKKKYTEAVESKGETEEELAAKKAVEAGKTAEKEKLQEDLTKLQGEITSTEQKYRKAVESKEKAEGELAAQKAVEAEEERLAEEKAVARPNRNAEQ